VKHRLQALWRWCTFAGRHYLDDLARMLVGDFEATPDHRKGCDPWGR
jgi:hypothetical protein